jgi:hypothetical protein
MRRVVRSFFGTAFQTPGSLAVRNGYDSYMVMSVAEGSKSFSHDPMDRFHRVAMSLLAQTFGLYDVNRGNVLSKSSREVTLIDFEQSLSRRTPVASRVPDRGIAEEMPWTSLEETNHIEDYLPAIQDWRAVFLSPRTQAQLEVILRESGFDAAEIPGVLAQLKANAADLEWALQNDVEFANLFVQRRAPR